MSIVAIQSILEASQARGADRLVLLAIVYHLNNQDPCGLQQPAWPSIGRLAKLTFLSERQVRRSIDRLEAMGELEIERRGGKNGVHHYRLGPRLAPQTRETPEFISPVCMCNPPTDCPAAERAGRKVSWVWGKCVYQKTCLDFVFGQTSPNAAAEPMRPLRRTPCPIKEPDKGDGQGGADALSDNLSERFIGQSVQALYRTLCPDALSDAVSGKQEEQDYKQDKNRATTADHQSKSGDDQNYETVNRALQALCAVLEISERDFRRAGKLVPLARMVAAKEIAFAKAVAAGRELLAQLREAGQ